MGNGWFIARVVGPPPCQHNSAQCIAPHPDAVIRYTDPQACHYLEVDLCCITLGRVAPEFLEDLADHYRTTLGLRVGILPPHPIPVEQLDLDRNQLPGATIINRSVDLHPELGPQGVAAITITPMDIYFEDSPNWRFAFGVRSTFTNGTIHAIISTHRMQAEDWAVWPGQIRLIIRHGYDEAHTAERLRKMTTKYIGIGYFGLPDSSDPESPLYNNILSVLDLDAMTDELPRASAR